MIAHGVSNHGGKRAHEMGRKNHRLRLESVALGRSRYCLLISVVQLEANRQADVLVDTLHRASVLSVGSPSGREPAVLFRLLTLLV